MLRGKLRGDPTLAIGRAKKRAVFRTTFTTDQMRAIVAAQDDARDRIALRLLLNYGLRNGTLQKVQFKRLDHLRKRLTIFTKGEKIREVPIPHTPFWFELERLIVETEAQPSHYLLQRQKAIPRRGRNMMHRFPEKPMGAHGLHDWLFAASNARPSSRPAPRSGERMHKARHSAGQRVLDATGNLKAVQKLLGHESIQTTGDIYTDWDIDQLAETLLEAVDE